MSLKAIWTSLFAVLLCFGVVSISQADLSVYTEDFESLDPEDVDALTNADWLVFGNVFDNNGVYQYGYGPFGAPNGGEGVDNGFSNLATGESGPDQGVIVLNTFNDYHNGNHNDAGWTIEANIFREQIIGAADLGTSWRFSFECKSSTEFGPEPPSETKAFIKVLDLVGGSFQLLAFETFDTTNIPDTWGGGSVDITIDQAWEGQLLQIGFLSTSQEYSPTGIFYDNLIFEPANDTGTVTADSLNALRGFLNSGTLEDTFESDDMYLKYNPGITLFPSEPPVWLEFNGTLPSDSPGSLSVTLEASANTVGLNQTIEMFNWNTGQYEEVDARTASSNSDSVVTIDVSSGISDYVQSGTGFVKSRMGWRATGPVFLFPWTVCIDQVAWTVE